MTSGCELLRYVGGGTGGGGGVVSSGVWGTPLGCEAIGML